MLNAGGLKVSSELLLKGAALFLLIDLVYLPVLHMVIRPSDFQRIRWKLFWVMAVFFFLLFGSIMSIFYWDSIYSYVFPDWVRWIIPPSYGILFAFVGLIAWHIAAKVPRFCVITFCLLGGLWGVLTHILAIYRGILDKPPMLQGSDPAAALIIAAFEFIFYWCTCLAIANLVLRFRPKIKH
jgi:hypothetical protein